MKKENNVLEETLAIAAHGYEKAYQFLLEEYARNNEAYGPQTLYFLSCLAGGAEMPQKALDWLRKAIEEKGWWYRPEVLEDDDLAALRNNEEFHRLKSLSDQRYEQAVSKTKVVFSWKRKSANHLFLAVHGNTQNAEIAREDWSSILGDSDQWQLETVQSGEPDGYGTYRWSYDSISYIPVAKAIEQVQKEGYEKIVCGGFSAGCDMLLRSILYTDARCDELVLQSPWIPILEEHAAELFDAVKEKGVKLKILCGSCDEDCLPMAKQLYKLMNVPGMEVELVIQEGNRHQFP